MLLQQQSELAVIQKQFQLPQRVWDAIVRDFGKPEDRQIRTNKAAAKERMRKYLEQRGIYAGITPEEIKERVGQGHEYRRVT